MLINMHNRRKFLGLSFDKLAQLTGITSRHLWAIEKGKVNIQKIKKGTMDSIAKSLKTTIDYLFYNKEDI